MPIRVKVLFLSNFTNFINSCSIFLSIFAVFDFLKVLWKFHTKNIPWTLFRTFLLPPKYVWFRKAIVEILEFYFDINRDSSFKIVFIMHCGLFRIKIVSLLSSTKRKKNCKLHFWISRCRENVTLKKIYGFSRDCMLESFNFTVQRTILKFNEDKASIC